MSRVLKNNLQVTFVEGTKKTTKTFSNVVEVVEDSKAQKFGELLGNLLPAGVRVEQVRTITTNQY